MYVDRTQKPHLLSLPLSVLVEAPHATAPPRMSGSQNNGISFEADH